MYLTFNHTLEVMKNMTYIEKMSLFSYNYSHFHKKGTLSCITNKNAFCFKKRVFYWASISAITVEKGVFFRPKSEKRVFFQTWVWAWYTLQDSRFKIRLFINHPRTSTISYAGNENNKHRSTILSTMLLDYSISRWLFFSRKCQDQ